MFPTNLTPSATVSFSLKFGNFIGAVLKFGPDHGMFGLGHLPLMILPYDSKGSHDHGLHHSTKPISQFWELETPNHHDDHTSSSSWWMFRCEVGHFPDICELKWGGASCGATWSEWSSLLISGLAHSGQSPRRHPCFISEIPKKSSFLRQTIYIYVYMKGSWPTLLASFIEMIAAKMAS